MSFDLYVLSARVPTDDPDELVELLEDPGHWDGELVPELQELADALRAEWPTLAEDTDTSPWSTHPLEQPEYGGEILALNIGWSHVEATVPRIQHICAERDLRIYDPQADTIAIPRSSASRWGRIRPLLRRLFRNEG